jgi:hypothetical protein
MNLAMELAAKAPTGGEGVKSGPLGLAAILLLCVAAYFLFKSMSKHLRKVREEFPTDERGNPKPRPTQNTPMETRDSSQDAPPSPDSS